MGIGLFLISMQSTYTPISLEALHQPKSGLIYLFFSEEPEFAFSIPPMVLSTQQEACCCRRRFLWRANPTAGVKGIFRGVAGSFSRGWLCLVDPPVACHPSLSRAVVAGGMSLVWGACHPVVAVSPENSTRKNGDCIAITFPFSPSHAYPPGKTTLDEEHFGIEDCNVEFNVITMAMPAITSIDRRLS